MTTSRVALAGRDRRTFSRKGISHNLFGGLAAACLALGCGWTVYTNIFASNVYPTLISTGYDEPVVSTPRKLAMRSPADAVREAFRALPAPTVASIKPKSTEPAAAPITPRMFNERFAAAEATSVASRAAEAAPPPEAPKLAAAPKTEEAPRIAEAAKANVSRVAEASKPKQASTQVALNVAPPTNARPIESAPAAASGLSLSDMAERAKAAVLSITSHGRQGIVEKLWGRQPSQGQLLAYASADTSVTGGIEHSRSPINGGSAPYDRDTAVYDITAHTVYLPDGTRLEAHSGLGSELDDPRSARIRMRGVTPPHIYELKPREALFHGVAALRLNPIGGEGEIYGRSGLLAHSYMLGPHGDSNGCVSFRDYSAFLHAYHNMGIRKLAVVARID